MIDLAGWHSQAPLRDAGSSFADSFPAINRPATIGTSLRDNGLAAIDQRYFKSYAPRSLPVGGGRFQNPLPWREREG